MRFIALSFLMLTSFNTLFAGWSDEELFEHGYHNPKTYHPKIIQSRTHQTLHTYKSIKEKRDEIIKYTMTTELEYGHKPRSARENERMQRSAKSRAIRETAKRLKNFKNREDIGFNLCMTFEYEVFEGIYKDTRTTQKILKNYWTHYYDD